MSDLTPNRTLTVDPDDAGMRLDAFLAGHFDSRAQAQRALAEGRIVVDGKQRSKRHTVKGGEAIEVLKAAPVEIAPPAGGYRILYEDEHLLVVDKDAGLVVHPGAGQRELTLVELLGDRIAGGDDPVRPGVVHRLDRGTSGLLVLGRSDTVVAELQAMIQQRAILRQYTALIEGAIGAKSGEIDAAIGRDPRRRTKMSTRVSDGKPALTEFDLQRSLPKVDLVKARLQTGRTHQLRVHFSAIGHPIVGDHEYGARLSYGLDRQFLHAARLEFMHPMGKKRVEVTSELPADLKQALEQAAADQ